MIFRKAAAALAALMIVAASLAPPAVTPAAAQFADQANVVTSAGGTANAQTGTVANVSSYNDVKNVILKFTPSVTNTNAATLTLNGFGTSPSFRKPTSGGLTALTGQELVVGVPVLIMYDGTFFDIMSTNTAQAPIAAPQGYLTPCNFANSPSVTGCTAGVPLPTADVTGTTAMYYQPVAGNQIPIYNGSAFVSTTFTELTLTLGSSNLANTIYDACVFSNAGTPTVVTSVAWSTSTAGSGARGTGAGTAQITMLNGIWVNAVAISGKNGASTFSIPANQCTIVATLYFDFAAGQLTFHRTFGQNRKWASWNFWNQQPIIVKAGDPANSWTSSSGIFRAANNAPATFSSTGCNVGGGSTCNSISVVTGLQQSQVDARNEQLVSTSTAGSFAYVAIGWNSVTVQSGRAGFGGVDSAGGSGEFTATAEYVPAPFLGLNLAFALEKIANGNMNFLGTEASMILSVKFNG